MADIEQQIHNLINADPLPVDAEAQLEALIEQLPEIERDTARGWYHEALFSAQQASGFDPSAARIEIEF